MSSWVGNCNQSSKTDAGERERERESWLGLTVGIGREEEKQQNSRSDNGGLIYDVNH
ncbi:hypothetical protein DFA_12238 [Cavenderia fasciculata]|uniref:Uncharacterized protein n=1 Tax=Cavenderia fasciculata TaxID=261658 RepID=F4QCU2_CACFS|nr:uncharacterized protein DFA_12238 [Cavenderia fasciculata]EGG14466.1 hypothetical protein DFA_12238 [Cavenderia fasciculata]|eukprot:XP_004353875.1 hypothetical protein DFA_12238 [Cavenderia fasciculata]